MSESPTARTINSASIERDITAINQALDHIRRSAADTSMRYLNAERASRDLAFVVARFLEQPEQVGTDALQGAYRTFMGRHSGNFTDSVMAVQS